MSKKKFKLKDGSGYLEREFHSSGENRSYLDNDGKDHRDGNKPAYIELDSDGTILLIEYHIHGVRKRTDGGPSSVDFHKDGTILGYGFTDENGKHHSPEPNQPCAVYGLPDDVCEVFYAIHGEPKREDGKASLIEYYLSEIDSISFDGTRAGTIERDELSGKAIKFYSLDNITFYEVKDKYLKDELPELEDNIK